MRVLVLLLMASLARAQSGMANGLYYEIAGSGHPLVFIHSGQLDSRMWDDQFAAYAKSYRAIRYDVRGFGKSSALASIHIPTLIVVGIPGAKEVVVDGAGHMVNMDKPAEFDRAVLTFLYSQ